MAQSKPHPSWRRLPAPTPHAIGQCGNGEPQGRSTPSPITAFFRLAVSGVLAPKTRRPNVQLRASIVPCRDTLSRPGHKAQPSGSGVWVVAQVGDWAVSCQSPCPGHRSSVPGSVTGFWVFSVFSFYLPQMGKRRLQGSQVEKTQHRKAE